MSTHRSTHNTTYQRLHPIDDGFGIDTIEVVIPVHPDSICIGDGSWKSERTTNHDLGSTSVSVANEQINGVNVRIDVYVESSRVKLGFNAARMVLPAPKLLTPDALVPLVGGVLPQFVDRFVPSFVAVDYDSGELVFDSKWQEQVLIRRLDIARNIEVTNAKSLMAAVAQSDAKYGLLRQVNRGKSWSVVDKSEKDGNETFYLKPGPWGMIFRFEARLQGRRRGRYGMTSLADVSGGACWEALSARWEATGHGKVFRCPGDSLAALMLLKPRDRTAVFGLLKA